MTTVDLVSSSIMGGLRLRSLKEQEIRGLGLIFFLKVVVVSCYYQEH